MHVPSLLQDDPVGNINLAMEIAEKHLDIPKMLDAEGERPCYLPGRTPSGGCMCSGHAPGSVKLDCQVSSGALRVPQSY